jgi:predicted lipid-binding transport protein (Tim44 family)
MSFREHKKEVIMKLLLLTFVLIVLLSFGAGSVIAQEPIIYPAQGQSQDQLEKDKFECYTWAKGETGFDPMQVPTASSPAPSQEKKSVGGSALKGGAVGGIGGAVLGGIVGGKKKAKKGAVIGGLTGGTLGGVRSSSQNRQAEQNRQQWEKQEANKYMRQRNDYNRAYSACLSGRGYTVK